MGGTLCTPVSRGCYPRTFPYVRSVHTVSSDRRGNGVRGALCRPAPAPVPLPPLSAVFPHRPTSMQRRGWTEARLDGPSPSPAPASPPRPVLSPCPAGSFSGVVSAPSAASCCSEAQGQRRWRFKVWAAVRTPPSFWCRNRPREPLPPPEIASSASRLLSGLLSDRFAFRWPISALPSLICFLPVLL